MSTGMIAVNEPIQICDTRFNFFPKSFCWRGKVHHVRAVDRCWTESRRQRLNTIERYCFRVRTADAVYDLHQEPGQNRWYLDRVASWER